MSFSSSFCRAVGVASLSALFLFVSSGAIRAEPELEVSIANAGGLPGDEDIPVEVFLKNYSDSIAGFELWFEMDRPNMGYFEMEIDTTGTLISGWDYIDCRTMYGNGLDVKVAALADITLPYWDRGFGPQLGEKPFIKLLVSIVPEPDPYSAPVIRLRFLPVIENFGFSTPDARSLGVSFGPSLDTAFFRCLSWSPPPDSVCLEYEEVSGPPYDSIFIYTSEVPFVDSSKVIFVDGSVTVAPDVCGDVDGSFDGQVDISDMQSMVDHLFISLKRLPIPELGNVDGSPDGVVDISDMERMIAYLFLYAEELECSE